jgi:hypothetical protein
MLAIRISIAYSILFDCIHDELIQITIFKISRAANNNKENHNKQQIDNILI